MALRNRVTKQMPKGREILDILLVCSGNSNCDELGASCGARKWENAKIQTNNRTEDPTERVSSGQS